MRHPSRERIGPLDDTLSSGAERSGGESNRQRDNPHSIRRPCRRTVSSDLKVTFANRDRPRSPTLTREIGCAKRLRNRVPTLRPGNHTDIGQSAGRSRTQNDS